MKLWRCMGSYPDGSVAPIGFMYYCFADSVESEFSEDITTLENIDLYWTLTNKDYKVARLLMQTLVADIGYENLTDTEKLLAAKWFAVSPATTLGDGTISYNNENIERDYISLCNNWNLSSRQARQVRFDKAYAQIMGKLGKTNGCIILTDLDPLNLTDHYIYNGYDSVTTGSREGLWDYIQSTAGTSWENTGLISKGWTCLDGSSLADLIIILMQILRDGNY